MDSEETYIMNDTNDDMDYNKMVQTYTKMDGILAIAVYIVFFMSFYLFIQLAIKTGVYLKNLDNIIAITMVFIIVRKRNQGLNSIGFSNRNLGKSVLLGFTLSLLFIVVPNLSLFNKNITSPKFYGEVVYFFLVISFTEELLFRGYIQTRMHGLIKSKYLSVFVVGFMFAIGHVPLDLIKYQIDIATYLNIDPFRIPKIMVTHVIFHLLYKRYNSIAAPIILHGFLDLL